MMTWRIPARNLAVRWALILAGIAAFIWTSVEDDRVWLATLLGVVMCGCILAHWLTGAVGGRELRGRAVVAAWVGFGALTGGGGIFSAVLLLAFKDARHAHPYPDAPVEVLAALFQRIPVWTIAGAFIGLGMYLLWRARSLR